MKTCTKCGLPKPSSEFYRRSAAPDGLTPSCKVCCRLYSTGYYGEHVPERCAFSKGYRKQHRTERRVYRRGYYRRHVREACAYSARYHREHPEKSREQSVRYHAAHPEESRKHLRIRRARKRAVLEFFTVEMEAFVLDSWGHRCAACGKTQMLCIDHWLPLSRGHALTVENAVVLCRPCNGGKGARLPRDVYEPRFIASVERHLEEQVYQWESLTPVA